MATWEGVTAMKSADKWFSEYDVYHRNGTNKLLHAICIPMIMLSLIGLLWSIPVNFGQPGWVNVATLLSAMTWVYYLMMSPRLGLGMFLVSISMIIMVGLADTYLQVNLALLSLVVFVLAWIGQFIGHKIEGKKPAFFEDLQFLLIGPLWLLGFVFRSCGIKY